MMPYRLYGRSEFEYHSTTTRPQLIGAAKLSRGGNRKLMWVKGYNHTKKQTRWRGRQDG